jgi:RNA polymerase sigma factor (sigma-70 family)
MREENDIKIMKKAALAYVCAANSFRHINKISIEDVLGDVYIQLTIAQNDYNEDKCKGNKDNYLIFIVKKRLIDQHRHRMGTFSKSKSTFILNLRNLDQELGEDFSLKDTIGASENGLDHVDTMDEYKKVVGILYKRLNHRHFEMYIMRVMHDYKNKEIAMKLGLTEGRVSQIFKNEIEPMVSIIKTDIRASQALI